MVNIGNVILYTTVHVYSSENRHKDMLRMAYKWSSL
jgi:hypothetical protein